MAGDESEATSRPIKSELAKLVAQLVVITLGGAAISFVFQYLGEERDARAQQAAFERQNFLDLHRDLNGLIADRVIVMDRVKTRLSSGDFAAALSLKRSDYDKAVAAWNQNVDRLLRSLKKLGACRPAQPIVPDQCNGALPAPTKDCIIDYYYDISWDEKRRDQNGSICKPRSVHFAFKNAGHKLGELLNSDWSDCLELTQSLIDREKAACRDKPLSAYTKEGIAEITRCLDKVKEMRTSALEICNATDGYRLNSELTEDLQYVRTRWAALDGWLTELEQKFGPRVQANERAATAKPQSRVNQSASAIPLRSAP